MSETMLNGRKATLEDVAFLAGVSRDTVLRFLDGDACVAVSSADCIRRAIKTLGYQRPSLLAASRAKQPQAIGLVLPHLADPFFAACAYEIDAVAKRHNYASIVACTNGDEITEVEEVRQFLQAKIAGLVIIPVNSGGRFVRKEELRGFPLVALDRPLETNLFDSVVSDNARAMQSATEHLLSHGHQRIMVIGVRQNLYTMQERYLAYRRTMLRAGLEPTPYIALTHGLEREELRSILFDGDRPTAVIAANNRVTRALLPVLVELNIAVPEELAWIGFDDLEFSEILRPRPTVLWQSPVEMGRTAAELLFRRIENVDCRTRGHRLKSEARLTIRESCGCKPAASMA